jgi:hypothetical protein
MAEFGNYLLQSSVCAALFYIVYYFFLRRLTFFKWNRFYLLASLVLSLFIPLLNIDVRINHDSAISQFIPSWYIHQSEESQSLINNPVNQSSFNWNGLFIVIYITCAVFAFIKVLVSLSIIAKAHKGKLIEKSDGIRIIEGSGKIHNCSFFNTVFLFPDLMEKEESRQIIAHEKCHIRLYHTCDKLFVHLVQVVFWFNPFIYLYRKSIDEVHEFEVDSLLTVKTDKKQYATILLDLALQRNYSLVNNFSSAPLKTRIKMLFSRPSRKVKTVLYATVIPVILLTILSFSVQKNNRLLDKLLTTVNADSNAEPQVSENKTSINSSNTQEEKRVEKKLDKDDEPKQVDQPINESAQQSKPELQKENSGSQKPEFPFLVRTTIKDEDGNDYDEVRLRFGGHYNLVGGVTKGGKILYLIGGKEYQEEEVKNFTQTDVAGLSCPCSVQAIHKDKEPLIAGAYEGMIKISNAN